MGSGITNSDVRHLHGCTRAFERLLDMSDDELAQQDIAMVNLICAAGLPGAEELDIPQCLARVDEWTERVRKETQKGFSRYRANPNPKRAPQRFINCGA